MPARVLRRRGELIGHQLLDEGGSACNLARNWKDLLSRQLHKFDREARSCILAVHNMATKLWVERGYSDAAAVELQKTSKMSKVHEAKHLTTRTCFQ